MHNKIQTLKVNQLRSNLQVPLTLIDKDSAGNPRMFRPSDLLSRCCRYLHHLLAWEIFSQTSAKVTLPWHVLPRQMENSFQRWVYFPSPLIASNASARFRCVYSVRQTAPRLKVSAPASPSRSRNNLTSNNQSIFWFCFGRRKHKIQLCFLGWKLARCFLCVLFLHDLSVDSSDVQKRTFA